MIVGMHAVLSIQVARPGTNPRELVDPIALSMTVQEPFPPRAPIDFTYDVDAEIVRDAQGKFHYVHELKLIGKYVFRWKATDSLGRVTKLIRVITSEGDPIIGSKIA